MGAPPSDGTPAPPNRAAATRRTGAPAPGGGRSGGGGAHWPWLSGGCGLDALTATALATATDTTYDLGSRGLCRWLLIVSWVAASSVSSGPGNDCAPLPPQPGASVRDAGISGRSHTERS